MTCLPYPWLPATRGSSDRKTAIIPEGLFEEALQEIGELGLLPDACSVESTQELIVGAAAGGTFLRARAGSPTRNLQDVRALRSIYSSSVEPLSVAVLGDRDLAYVFNAAKSEVVIEATAGQPRLIVLAGTELRSHETLGAQEGSRVTFGGLAPNTTYIIGLVLLGSPAASSDEAALIEKVLALEPSLRGARVSRARILREPARPQDTITVADADPSLPLGPRPKRATLPASGETQRGLGSVQLSLDLDLDEH